MITLLVWCIVNGFLLHFDPHAMAEDTKMLIHVICIASDLNLFTTFIGK
jgi:hypothetical protein